MRKSRWIMLLAVWMLLAGMCLVQTARAGDQDAIKGWEKDGEYDKLYEPAEREKIKGVIVDFVDITPMEGMAPGIGVTFQDRFDPETFLVHIGPKAYVEAQKFPLEKGETVKIYGAWAEHNDKDFFIVAKIKKENDNALKVRRTKDGYPFWSMPPEMLKDELENQ